jgi:hypothetical protein
MRYIENIISRWLKGVGFAMLLLCSAVAAYGQYNDCTVGSHPIFSPGSQLPDSIVCAGDSVTFTVGYSSGKNFVIAPHEPEPPEAHSMFIPNSIYCEDTCVFSSTIHYSGYEYNDTVAGPNSIRYVRLNIEHATPENILIQLRCPNGQTSTILKCALISPDTTHISNCILSTDTSTSLH